MSDLTPLERKILHFIQTCWKAEGHPPSLQQIAFRFACEESVARRHVSFLHDQGYLVLDPSEKCGVRMWTPWSSSPKSFDIPVFGSIPCGLAEEKAQEIRGYIPISLEKLGISPSPYLFAVEAQGDSMIGRQIAEGDYVILDKNRVPRSGDVVAALLGTESTLKTFIRDDDGKTFLRPENPKYKNIFPSDEAVIQGVMVMLIRKPH